LLIFFDTEFSSLYETPKLISIGLISEDGKHEFYAELTDTYKQNDLSEFALSYVIPLLSEEMMLSKHQLNIHLKQWIESFDIEVMLASDNYSWDWPFIQEIFHEDSWPKNLNSECFLLNMNYMKNADIYYDAVQNSYELGLKKHHALDDAKANRLGWLASEEA
jgi:uncharacterized protein YrzB (UPF0473 family)